MPKIEATEGSNEIDRQYIIHDARFNSYVYPDQTDRLLNRNNLIKHIAEKLNITPEELKKKLDGGEIINY